MESKQAAAQFMLGLIRTRALRLFNKFDPDQPRDEDGNSNPKTDPSPVQSGHAQDKGQPCR